MKGKKLTYIVSDIDKSLHFEWITPYLKTEFQLSFILIGRRDSALEDFLKSHDVPVFPISYSRKADLVHVWLRIFKILFKYRPDIVHTHLWKANLLGLPAAWLAGISKRIYTRHHATIHYKEFPSGLKWDRLNNRMASQIIAISKNVEHLLIECDKAERKKVRLLHHGFAFSYFQDVTADRINYLYEKYKISRYHHPVVGVISRFTEWKGVQFIIPAFEKLRISFPLAHLILANAHGNYEDAIDRLLTKLPENSFTKIGFENDLAALYKLFDIFVHAPVDPDSEAFGQTYVEPLIVGVPCIFTLSGIAKEFIEHEQNALVVDFEDADQIYVCMKRILHESDLRETLAENGKRSVTGFTMEKYLKGLKDLYLE
ncbi:MAG: glycosyltransferase [Cyclobacteriaceae bacterium]